MTARYAADGSRAMKIHVFGITFRVLDDRLIGQYAIEYAKMHLQTDYPRRTIIGYEAYPRQDWFARDRIDVGVYWYRCPCTHREHPHGSDVDWAAWKNAPFTIEQLTP